MSILNFIYKFFIRIYLARCIQKICAYSLLIVLCLPILTAQEKIQIYAFSPTAQALKVAPNTAQKIVTVSLQSIFMGECGNDNHCHHEPVAGRVVTHFFHRTEGLMGTTQIWQSRGHSLVCDNLYGPVDPNSHQLQGDGLWTVPRALGQNNYAFLDNSFVNNDYYLSIQFNLGVEHQDNPFASRGGHWLTHGDNMLQANIPFNAALMNSRGITTIGPFTTQSNRCHEFWLRLSFAISE